MIEPCPNCGRLNRPGARYCASCQSPLGAADARISPGQLLDGGNYRVVRPLGKGGMGAVYLVAQTKAFDRLAVLKEVIEYFDPLDPDARREAAQRFEAEARTLGDLKHPGIPDLYAYFSAGGHNYLIMEYIEGPDLADSLTSPDRDGGQAAAGKPLPMADVLHYTIEICTVLEYLAGRQPPVVHNDIKPGNIIVDQHSGRAVLVDFGTAKTRYLALAGDSLYGTVGYAAPELYQGHSEPRSDVYSLSATAYHLLTDDDPRDHPGQYPQLDALPPDLADILRAALAEDVAQRPTAAEFRQQLEAYQAGQTGPLKAVAFPDGDAADDRDELLSLAVKHWRYAAGLLADGALIRWLRHTLHDEAAARAAEVAVRQWPGDPDSALDAFIGQLDPGLLPPGKMELRTTNLRPQIGLGQKTVQAIEIANRGQGLLRGQVLSSQPWLLPRGNTFTCPPGSTCTVSIEIDAATLAAGQNHVAAVTLIPAKGMPEVVPVQVTVVTPTIRVEPGRLDFGEVRRRGAAVSKTLTVTNPSPAIAGCKLLGLPEWLIARPAAFRLPPGAQEIVTLELRPHKVPGRGQEIVLTVAVDQGRLQQIAAAVRIKDTGWWG
ncbi:MAG: protein kinase [Anaerolineae bacterium]|nr:protein kinase [Anaerolineae bacterium]